MEKDEFFNYRMLAYEVKKLRSTLSTLEASIYSPTRQRHTHTPRGNSSGHSVDDVIASYAALEELYRGKLTAKNAQLLAVEQAIESLADPAQRMVMRYRYIDGHGWRKVCGLMQPRGYSERTVYRLHGEALQKLKEV